MSYAVIIPSMPGRVFFAEISRFFISPILLVEYAAYPAPIKEYIRKTRKKSKQGAVLPERNVYILQRRFALMDIGTRTAETGAV